MRSLATATLFALLSLSAIWEPALGQGLADIQFTTAHLGGNVYMLASRAGGNLAACVGMDGVFLVDAEYAELTEKAREAIAAISDQPIRVVLNTHWHFDHTGGNESFATAGALIVAHENVREKMAADQHLAVINVDVPASPPPALPVVTLQDGATFHFNGEEIVAFHAPEAHTDGDLIVHFRDANVVHMGDIVFNRGYPYIDNVAGGTIDGMIAAIQRALEVCDGATKIIPGHGPLSDRAELAGYRKMLQEFRAAIAAEIAAGKSLDQIQQAKPTAALDADWGGAHFPPPLFTEMVFRSLGGE